TLTLGTVVLEQHVDVYGRDCTDVLRWACVNSALESGLRSPMDAAILAHDHPSVAAYRKRGELPFDFERRRVRGLAGGPDGVTVVAKGAPESLLPLCTQVELDGTVGPLTPEPRTAAEATFQRLSAEGYRVLGIAYRRAPDAQANLAAADEHSLVLSGFAAF